MKSGHKLPPDMSDIIDNRIKKRKANPDSRLNQGTSLWWIPYTVPETWEYLKGFFSTGKSSKENPRAISDKNEKNHVVGVKHAVINNNSQKSSSDVDEHSMKQEVQDSPASFLVVGDVLLSKSGKSIILGPDLKKALRNANAIVLNIESPVVPGVETSGRGGLLSIALNGFNFALQIPEGYLRSLVQEIKSENKNIQIIYDIANNHTLDTYPVDYATLSTMEQGLYDIDTENFPIFQTIRAIRKIDPDAMIIGVWTQESEFKKLLTGKGTYVDLQTDPVAVVELSGVKIGFMAMTDILNYNARHWKRGRVIRPEDVEDMIADVKSDYGLDKFFLLMHGGVEQTLYPSDHWQDLHEQFLEHCDGIFSHGSHLPGLFQVKQTSHGPVPFETSLGNLFCPTNLRNTGVGTLLKATVNSSAISYEEIPIEATIAKDGHPHVDIPGTAKSYLTQRWCTLHKHAYPECLTENEKKEQPELAVEPHLVSKM